MITKEQLKLYIKLGGDIDMYQRLSGKLNDNEIISDEDWGAIDDLSQRLVIRNNELESEKYAESTDVLLDKHIANKEALEMLHNFSTNTKIESPWWKFW